MYDTKLQSIEMQLKQQEHTAVLAKTVDKSVDKSVKMATMKYDNINATSCTGSLLRYVL